MTKEQLETLAHLIRGLNAARSAMAALIGRPADIGNLGEAIAAAVFGIELVDPASRKGYDGMFLKGALAGKTVDIKWYPRLENLLALDPENPPHYYLVMAGPRGDPESPRSAPRPWCIESVYLFNGPELIARCRKREVAVGVATTVRKADWVEAEIYPKDRNQVLTLTSEERRWLEMFAPGRVA